MNNYYLTLDNFDDSSVNSCQTKHNIVKNENVAEHIRFKLLCEKLDDETIKIKEWYELQELSQKFGWNIICKNQKGIISVMSKMLDKKLKDAIIKKTIEMTDHINENSMTEFEEYSNELNKINLDEIYKKLEESKK